MGLSEIHVKEQKESFFKQKLQHKFQVFDWDFAGRFQDRIYGDILA